MDVCTIIAKNYFAEHHPEVTLNVLIIDDIEGYVDPEAEPFEVIMLDMPA